MVRLKVNYNHLKYLAKNIDYKPKTGVFYWASDIGITNPKRPNSCIRKGDRVYIASHGLIHIKNGQTLAAVLAWYISTGEIPKYAVQRINGNPDDYRLSNLLYLPYPNRLTQENLKASCLYRNGEFSYRYESHHRRRLRVISKAGDKFIPLFGWTYRYEDLKFLWERGRWPEQGEADRPAKKTKNISYDGKLYHACITVFGKRFRLGSHATFANAQRAIMYAKMIRSSIPEYHERDYAVKNVDPLRKQEVWDWFKFKIES